MTTPTAARDELYGLVTTAWGDLGPIDYEDVPRSQVDEPIPPATPTPWLRIQMRHTFGGVATLANHQGVKRHRRTGTFIVQVFVPLGGSLLDTEESAIVVVHALEDADITDPHVLLRNVRMNEIGSEGHWFQTNVLADFEYDEVR
jgi:hypothetical protein